MSQVLAYRGPTPTEPHSSHTTATDTGIGSGPDPTRLNLAHQDLMPLSDDAPQVGGNRIAKSIA
jgi:hypothetical protein